MIFSKVLYPEFKMKFTEHHCSKIAGSIRRLQPGQLQKLAANFTSNKQSRTSAYQNYELYQFKALNPKKTFTEMAKIFSNKFQAWIA